MSDHLKERTELAAKIAHYRHLAESVDDDRLATGIKKRIEDMTAELRTLEREE